MLVNTFNKLATYIANLLDVIIRLFLSCLDLDLSTFLNAFPAFGTTYSIFRMIGLALALIIATVSLFRFFTAQDTSSLESPVFVLLRTAATAALIYFGGYVLEYIVGIASFSYGIFLNLETAPAVPLSGLFDSSYLSQLLASTSASQVISPGLLTAVAVLMSLLLVIMIAINLFKLLIEVAERFMVVGVLVFTAPLSFSTFASQNSSNIFKNWCKMFLSSCVMMTISVFFLKVIVSGLYAINGESYWLQLLLILALCKIAQRIDSYMAQLGLGTAITGGGTAADLFGGIKAIEKGAEKLFGGNKNKGGSKSTVLGSGKDEHIRESRSNGFLGGLINGARSAKLAYSQGKGISEAAKAAGRSFINTMTRNPVGKAVESAKEAPEGQKVAAAIGGAAKGTAESIAQAVAPKTMSDHHANAAKRTEAKIAENKAASDESASRSARSAHQPMSEEAKQQVADKLSGKGLSREEKNDNFAKYGVAPEGQSALGFNPDTHEMDLKPEAKAAGLSLDTVVDNQGNSSQVINGGNTQMAELMSNEYGRDKQVLSGIDSLPSDEQYRDSAIKALKNDSSNAAQAKQITEDSERLEQSAFNDKWGAAIDDKAAEFRANDAANMAATNLDYANTLLRTAETMSSTAAIGAMFDTTKAMQGDDSLGNAMMKRAFPEITNTTGELREISAYNRGSVPMTNPDGSGTVNLDGGRVIEAKYGNNSVVHIYNHTAYTSMSDAEQQSLSSYQAADGRQFWIDKSFSKTDITAPRERSSGRSGSHIRPPKKK